MENKQDELVAKIETAIDSEHFFAICFAHLLSLTKNGRIKDQFYSYVNSAKTNIRLLLDYLPSLGVNNFVLEEKCKLCKINPDSFSLIGAINLSLEITGVAIGAYKDMLTFVDNAQGHKLFQKLLKEKILQADLLKKEKEFHEDKTYRFSAIEQFCIPYIRSKLGVI